MTMHSTLAKSSKDASAEGLEMFGSTLATQVKKKNVRVKQLQPFREIQCIRRTSWRSILSDRFRIRRAPAHRSSKNENNANGVRTKASFEILNEMKRILATCCDQ